MSTITACAALHSRSGQLPGSSGRPAAQIGARLGASLHRNESRTFTAVRAVAGAPPTTADAASNGAATAAAAAPAVVTPAVVTFPAPAPSRMVEGNRAFVEAHRIRGNEVGPDQRTNIISIATLLQEAAGNHAVAMWGRSSEGFATDPAFNGLIFVMTRMQIQMEKYPRWGDVVEIRTWFQEDGKLAAQRDWLITCKATGELLGRATSTWVMINMQTRRLCKFPEAARQKCALFQLEPPRHTIAREFTRQRLPELGLPAEIVGPIQVARRSDVDMNGHVNNTTYFAWAMETVPSTIYNGAHLYQMEIDFKAECHCGDLVESLAGTCGTQDLLALNGAGPESLSFVHVLRRCQGEVCTELVRARTTWRSAESASDLSD